MSSFQRFPALVKDFPLYESTHESVSPRVATAHKNHISFVISPRFLKKKLDRNYLWELPLTLDRIWNHNIQNNKFLYFKLNVHYKVLKP